MLSFPQYSCHFLGSVNPCCANLLSQFDTLAGDGSVMEGARAIPAMTLLQFNLNILVSELKHVKRELVTGRLQFLSGFHGDFMHAFHLWFYYSHTQFMPNVQV